MPEPPIRFPAVQCPGDEKLSVWTLNNWYLSLGSLGETLAGLHKPGKEVLILTCFSQMGSTLSTPYLRGSILPFRQKIVLLRGRRLPIRPNASKYY